MMDDDELPAAADGCVPVRLMSHQTVFTYFHSAVIGAAVACRWRFKSDSPPGDSDNWQVWEGVYLHSIVFREKQFAVVLWRFADAQPEASVLPNSELQIRDLIITNPDRNAPVVPRSESLASRYQVTAHLERAARSSSAKDAIFWQRRIDELSKRQDDAEKVNEDLRHRVRRLEDIGLGQLSQREDRTAYRIDRSESSRSVEIISLHGVVDCLKLASWL
jgi:hypothetical protein